MSPPTTPTSSTKSARSEMSSRRQRELERKKTPVSREPLSMNGRSSGMFCTPPSLAGDDQPSALTRSERVRKDASARFEREKQRGALSTSSKKQHVSSSLKATFDDAAASDENAPLQEEEDDSATDAAANDMATEDEARRESSSLWKSLDVGTQPQYPLTSLSPRQYPLTSLSPNQEWRRAASGDAALLEARQELLDKFVWVRVGDDAEVAARVRSVEWTDRLVLGVDVLPNDAGLDLPRDAEGAAFVDPADVTLLSMKELLDLPPPPPPVPAQTPPPANNDENRPPSDDLTPPQLRPARTPSWAQPRSADLRDALDRQSLADPPLDFDRCFAGGNPRSCDLAQVFARPSLAAHGYRETGDWSQDDW